MGEVLGLLIGAIIEAFTPEQQAEVTSAKDEVARVQAEMRASKAEFEKLQEEHRKEGKKMSEAAIDDFQTKRREAEAQVNNRIRQLPDPPKREKFAVAAVGHTCAGKSSTLNALWGTKCAVSALRETTGANSVYKDKDVEVFDVYGDSDSETYADINKLLLLKTIHVILFVYTDELNNSETTVKLLSCLKIPIVFFRNKCDHWNAAKRAEVKAHDLNLAKTWVEAPENEAKVVDLVIGAAEVAFPEGTPKPPPQHIDTLKQVILSVKDASRRPPPTSEQGGVSVARSRSPRTRTL